MRSLREVRYAPYSIVNSFGIPAIHMDVVMNPVECIGDFDVPLLAIPHRRTPPIAGCAPGTGSRYNRAVHAVKSNPGRRAVAELNSGVKRRPKTAEGKGGVS